jgi:dynein heavy chain
VAKSARWPLMIDPQGQALNWIKKMEKNKLIATGFNDTDFFRKLENAIRFGLPTLIEDVNDGAELKSLEPLLLKQIVKQSGRKVIRLGDSYVEYSSDFRLYITTKHHNPNFSPDISTKVALLNFTVTPEGLEDQLLGIVVAKERPDLEDQKNQITVENANNKKQLKVLEDEILDIMSSAEGHFLEDDVLVDKLNQAKTTYSEIQTSLSQAENTERIIDSTRMLFFPSAKRAANLFFCVSHLAAISPMYQYSLDFIVKLFKRAIDETPKPKIENASPLWNKDDQQKLLNDTSTLCCILSLTPYSFGKAYN